MDAVNDDCDDCESFQLVRVQNGCQNGSETIRIRSAMPEHFHPIYSTKQTNIIKKNVAAS